jgi:hypothetical protein
MLRAYHVRDITNVPDSKYVRLLPWIPSPAPLVILFFLLGVSQSYAVGIRVTFSSTSHQYTECLCCRVSEGEI